MNNLHTFYIPVMGTGFTIDTPVRVARYGLSSVVSIVDDILIEKMRKFYCELTGQNFVPITRREDDFRAKRITAYLDVLGDIVREQFDKLRASEFDIGSEITKYFELLPNESPVKRLYTQMQDLSDPSKRKEIEEKLRAAIRPGSIDVNIMVKLDRTNYAQDGTILPSEYSDALAALRGFAKSALNSAVVFSAGFNRRLYSYVENFKDFYADAQGKIKKKIVIKVSDFRSAMTQGKFFAKKGIWVSEYRIESGLNCGGHAFATDGFLLGPVLDEFRKKRDELKKELFDICNKALKAKAKPLLKEPPEMRVTAQGGIGTNAEREFLCDHYGLDATGWATPFLLCPEVTNVEDTTLDRLKAAKEDDVFLSDVSPLGVPFNNLRRSPSEKARLARIESGKPGSSCPNGFLVSNTEFGERPICTASRNYQKQKIEALENNHNGGTSKLHEYKEIVNKSCICHDLAGGVIVKNKINKVTLSPAICPGPNIAYFSKVVSLKEMADHIYGRINIMTSPDRPHMFIKELRIYIDYWKDEVNKFLKNADEKKRVYLTDFKKNLDEGIEYYRGLVPKITNEREEIRQKILSELNQCKAKLETFFNQFFPQNGQPASSDVPSESAEEVGSASS